MALDRGTFVQGLKVGLPTLFSFFFWIYTHRPEGQFLWLATMLMSVLAVTATRVEEMLRTMFYLALMLSFYTFGFSILINFAGASLWFMFIVTFLGMLGPRTRRVIPMAVTGASVGLAMDQGYYAGVNRVISCMLAFVVVLFFMYLLSGTTREVIRSTLVSYLSEIRDFLDDLAQREKPGASYTEDLEVTREKLAGMALTADALINRNEYVLPKTVKFVKGASRMLRGLRDCAKDIAVIYDYPRIKSSLREVSPLVTEMISDLSGRLSLVMEGLRNSRVHIKDQSAGPLGKRWNEEYARLMEGGGPLDLDKARVLFSLECMRKDLAGIEESLRLTLERS